MLEMARTSRDERVCCPRKSARARPAAREDLERRSVPERRAASACCHALLRESLLPVPREPSSALPRVVFRDSDSEERTNTLVPPGAPCPCPILRKKVAVAALRKSSTGILVPGEGSYSKAGSSI